MSNIKGNRNMDGVLSLVLTDACGRLPSVSGADNSPFWVLSGCAQSRVNELGPHSQTLSECHAKRRPMVVFKI